MISLADPVAAWALMMFCAVVAGTMLLIAIAFLRRWQQTRFSRELHEFQRRYRPLLAKALAGEEFPAAVLALSHLSHVHLDLLFDPFFSKRKLSSRQLGFLDELCRELGLIAYWQSRIAAAGPRPIAIASGGAEIPGGMSADPLPYSRERTAVRHLRHAKSIRNLGKLRHRPSWHLLMKAVDDRRADIRTVALRSLAAIAAPESFPALCERLYPAVLAAPHSSLLSGLRAAMVDFDLSCAPALVPSLRHADGRLRLRATEILRTIVVRAADRQPHLVLTPASLGAELVETLLGPRAADDHADTRAYTAEIIVFLDDPRVTSVLRALLADPQWSVRARALRALSHWRRVSAYLPFDLREFLEDPHQHVRETAIQALITWGQEGKRQLFECFIASSDSALRRQIVEVIERHGLMPGLVEGYSAGTGDAGAHVVEQLAADPAPAGLAGVLRTVNPEVRKKFLDRFLPATGGNARLLHEAFSRDDEPPSAAPAADFLPPLAA